MLIVLNDLILDLSLRIPAFPIKAQDLEPLTYLSIGPGGATNVAIMAARFGLPVACLGQIGDDQFGQLLLNGLRHEGIDVDGVIVSQGVRTPVAGVVVDEAGEPAYLGFPGSLDLAAIPEAWRSPLVEASAVFADGWIEYQAASDLILDAFRLARGGGATVFFDPGPGNPRVDNAWHRDAASLATVVLVNEDEAARLGGSNDMLDAGRAILTLGVELVIIKRSEAGILLMTDAEIILAPGFPVELVDATGAGDSAAGAVIYAVLNGWPLSDIAALANATGAAKVQKRGTGHNVPTLDEVQAVLERFTITLSTGYSFANVK